MTESKVYVTKNTKFLEIVGDKRKILLISDQEDDHFCSFGWQEGSQITRAPASRKKQKESINQNSHNQVSPIYRPDIINKIVATTSIYNIDMYLFH